MTTDAHGRPNGAPLVFSAPDVRAPSHAERARTLVAGQSTASLGTIALAPAGTPYVSYVTFALDEGTPLFCLSRIAEHGKNLASDARASLLVHESGNPDPLANGRVTLLGRVGAPVDRERAKALFVAAQPSAAYYVDFQDFALHALTIESLRYIGGYGRMSWVEASDWHAASPDPIAGAARAVLEHMNADHADALVLYARAFSEAHDATAGTMTAIDRYGFEMTVDTARGRGPLRLVFPEPIASAKDARVALVAMVASARARLATPS